MNWPYELQIGWRYTRAGRAGRRNGFISFISGVSMLGIALGVAALIIVLSVMNGFQKEVRDRMLSVIAHIEISDADGAALPDWQRTASEARKNPEVVGAAPFVASQALIARGDDMRGIVVRGIVPQRGGDGDRRSRRSSRTRRSRAWCRARGASSSAASWRARSACTKATRSPSSCRAAR